MATATLKRPDAAAAGAGRKALAQAIAELAQLDAAIAALRADEEAKAEAVWAARTAAEAAAAAIDEACPRPVVTRRASGLGPLLGDAPPAPFELSEAHSAAVVALATAIEARDAVREAIADLEYGRPRKIAAVDLARREVMRGCPSVMAMAQKAAEAMTETYSLCSALRWMIREGLVSAVPVPTSRWSTEPPLAAVVDERFSAQPDHWPGLRGAVAGEGPWADALEALKTDPNAEVS